MSIVESRTSPRLPKDEEQLSTGMLRLPGQPRRSKGGVKQITNFFISLAVLIGAGVVWEVVAISNQQLFFPPISAILVNAWEQWMVQPDGAIGPTEVLLGMLSASFARVGPGLMYGALAGITFGILLARINWMYELFFPVFQFLRAIPSSAKIPMFMALLGITEVEKISVIAVGVALPLMMNVMDGVKNIDPTLESMAEVYKISRWDRLWGIIIPSAGPQTFAGLRVATMVALIVLTLAELTGASSGIGYYISYASSNFKPLDMWSGVLLLGALGYVLNLLLTVIEHRALRWQRESLGGSK